LHEKVRRFGEANTKLSIASNEKILEVFNSYRESVVRNRRYYYSESVRTNRYELARIQAEMQFIPNISKYIIETAMVVGGLALCAAQFAVSDASHAVATLAVFLAAGTRIAPAMMRIQQGAINVKGSLGAASSTLQLIEELKGISEVEYAAFDLSLNHGSFVPEVKISDLSITYPNTFRPAINIRSLKIPPGTFVAVVGPSGAGKTTLVDLILGILIPDSGAISISGKTPMECINTWPGAIGYVPQDVSIIKGTILENITMGYPNLSSSSSRAVAALQIAQLEDFVNALPNGINTQVGERGSQISGGQRQRLGIARALYTQPRLLVLDEATSALDGQVEADIGSSIQELKGHTTVIAIAHRLSTVINADKLIYISDGEIVAEGTFMEIRKLVPDFDKQARLMGAS
jgi:ABC-type multidrug transport system fused ATPase/permease subunit